MVDIDLKKLSFLQRYPSEWDPRDQGKTKGGYIEGMILGVPQDASTMVLQTVPDMKYATMMVSDAQLSKFEPELVSSIHPLLLHVVISVLSRARLAWFRARCCNESSRLSKSMNLSLRSDQCKPWK